MAILFDWLRGLLVTSVVLAAYFLIYSAGAWIFKWPQFSKREVKELRLTFVLFGVAIMPAMLVLQRYRPDVRGWKLGLFLAVFGILTTRLLRIRSSE